MMGSHLLVVGIRPTVAVAIVAQLGSDVVAELVVVRVHGASFTLGTGLRSERASPAVRGVAARSRPIGSESYPVAMRD